MDEDFNDDNDQADLSWLDVANAMTKATSDEETPSEPEDDSDDLDIAVEVEGDEETTDAEGDEPEAEAKPTKRKAEDDDEFEYTVNGETKTLSVKEARRLAGQEAALTQKTQALAELRKSTERQGLAATTILQEMHSKALKHLEQYKDVDLFVASRELSVEDFKVLRSEVEAAKADVSYIETSAKTLLTEVSNQRTAQLQEQAKATVAELTNPQSRFHVKDWNDALYGEILTYSVNAGLDREVARELVDPAAITLIRKAMLYDKARENAKTKVTPKVLKAPRKAMTKDATTDTAGKASALLRRRAQTSGSLDDVVALMSSAE